MKKSLLPLPEYFVIHAIALINHVHSQQAAVPSAWEDTEACFRRNAHEFRNGEVRILVDTDCMRVLKPR